MFFPFGWKPPPPKRDGIDKIIESEAFQADAKRAAEADRFWSDRRKVADRETRAAAIQEARLKYLHAGGKP